MPLQQGKRKKSHRGGPIGVGWQKGRRYPEAVDQKGDSFLPLFRGWVSPGGRQAEEGRDAGKKRPRLSLLETYVPGKMSFQKKKKNQENQVVEKKGTDDRSSADALSSSLQREGGLRAPKGGDCFLKDPGPRRILFKKERKGVAEEREGAEDVDKKKSLDCRGRLNLQIRD